MPSVLLASSVFSRVISCASMLTVNTSIAIGIPRTKAECRRGVHLDHLSKGSHKSISNPQQVLPLAKLALEAHAFGDLEGRDDAPLDLLARLSGGFACSSIFPARLIEVGNKLFIASLSRRVRGAVRKACQHPENHLT